MGKKRFGSLNRKTINIMIGIIVFIVGSTAYDLFLAQDGSIRRWFLFIGGIILVVLAISLRIINSTKVRKIIERQMGD